MAPDRSPRLRRRGALALGIATTLAVPCSSAGSMPVAVFLPPLGKRCIHEEVPVGSVGTVEVFTESGGKLDVHLTVEGPFVKAWGDVPEATADTKVHFDSVVGNGGEQFDDSFTFSFSNTGDAAGSTGDVYQVCVANDMNHLLGKTVQLDLRSSVELEKRKKSASAEPIHLVSNPDQLTEEERKAEANKQAEVAHLEASIKRLKLGLRQLQKQQQQERHRQSGHTAATEDANNHVVVYSLVETVAFVGAACFQLFFIRNWFEGKVGSNNKGRQWA